MGKVPDNFGRICGKGEMGLVLRLILRRGRGFLADLRENVEKERARREWKCGNMEVFGGYGGFPQILFPQGVRGYLLLFCRARMCGALGYR